MSLGIALNLQPLRFVYGSALIALLFVHFGVYHSIYEPSVMGILWGYYLPIGYLGLALGLLVMAYPKIGLTRKLSFASLMITIGLLLILTALVTPREFFINLIHQTRLDYEQTDIDYPVGNWLIWGLTLFSVTTGLMLKIKRTALQKRPKS